MSIPIIDCSEISGRFGEIPAESLQTFANEFWSAMQERGFVYLKNHDVDMQKVQRLHGLSREFFTLPTSIKQKYRKEDAIASFNGYIGPGDEFHADAKNPELKEVWDIWGDDAHDETKFPTEVNGLKSAFDDLRTDCANLVMKLLCSVAIYLKLENQGYFLDRHLGISNQKIRTNTQFRILYYYPLYEQSKNGEIPQNAMRCGDHTDWGTMTLLFQDMVGGLEVMNTQGEWVHATPIENTILVNTGQLLEIWSGGRLRATPHRVRILEDERLLKNARQSLVYFVDPDWEAEVEPILPLIPGKEYLADDTPITAYEHSKKLIQESAYS